MNIKPRHDFKPCVPGAFGGGLWRTEFFDGMVLSEDDMKREQSYWQMKRRLTNRALGQGVVWGLSVEWDEKSRCFTVCPGYGLSCCGDDLVVECPETVCERELIDPCSKDFRKLLANRHDPCDDCETRPDSPVEACLLLEYVECPEDPRQVFEDPCANKPQGCRYGAVRETTRLRLVPPPCPEPQGPIERFSDKIEQLRKKIAESGVDMPKAAFSRSKPQLHFGASSVGGTTSEFLAFGQFNVGVGDKTELTIPSEGAPRVSITLSPMPGYVFSRVATDGVDRSGAATMMGITNEYPLSTMPIGLWREVEVEMLPLLGTSDGYSLKLKVATRQAGAETKLTAEITDAAMKRPDNCSAPLVHGLFFASDPGDTLRTLTLALTCGWFRGLLGTSDCGDAKAQEPTEAQGAVAWMICWVAWRMIYGIDISKQDAPSFEKCLQALFQEWCCGFHYKGPRCDCDAHGIILGCVQISPKGRILCFDEWEHRRYVLTGPLMTHWAGQFGLAPIDVSATRLASWICCVARTPMPRMPDALPQLAQHGYIPLGTGGLGFGKPFVGAPLTGGAKIDLERKVSNAAFLGHAIRMLSAARDGGLSSARSVEAISADDLGVHLVVPRETAAAAKTPLHRETIAGLISRDLSAAPAMARQPMADFAETFAAETALSDLKAPTGNQQFDPLVAALDAAGVSTIADLVATGPEAAVALVRERIAANRAFTERSAEKTMSIVYNTAMRAVTEPTVAIRTEAQGRDEEDAFTRADLAEPATLAAMRKAANEHLRGRGISASALRGIATRVAASRP